MLIKVNESTVFQSVGDMTVRYYEEMRRHYYVTPSSYLELLKQYKTLLEKKTQQTTQMRDRIKNGLHVSNFHVEVGHLAGIF